ncbi:hypothetical protein [Bacillus chungangensis]|uniref:Membrane-associated HD superfamily phosphohydrolase n=1 Tax=Bacillus chungangensis TaxID=587633 RepID=A0ABT9WVA9_9BACI|nr:hypothetical protein [Bacillus chungangensis]MDQ0177140.1 membrane-associated HD superfamily phosphohydrolase [Bacillus chungangensis]
MSEQKYTRSEILENLSHIKTLTNYKTEYCKQSSVYFIVWGIISMIAYPMSSFSLSSFTIGVSWFTLGMIGWAITLTIYFKQDKTDPLPLFLRTQLRYTSIALFVILAVFLFLIYSGLLPYTFENILFYIVLLVSIMYLLLGIVLTKEIFFMGVWLSILGMITFFFFPNVMNIIFAVIGGGSLVLTGLILKRKGHGNE